MSPRSCWQDGWIYLGLRISLLRSLLAELKSQDACIDPRFSLSQIPDIMYTVHLMPYLINACTRSDNGYQCAAYDREYDRKPMDFLTGPGFLTLD